MCASRSRFSLANLLRHDDLPLIRLKAALVRRGFDFTHRITWLRTLHIAETSLFLQTAMTTKFRTMLRVTHACSVHSVRAIECNLKPISHGISQTDDSRGSKKTRSSRSGLAMLNEQLPEYMTKG